MTWTFIQAMVGAAEGGAAVLLWRWWRSIKDQLEMITVLTLRLGEVEQNEQVIIRDLGNHIAAYEEIIRQHQRDEQED